MISKKQLDLFEAKLSRKQRLLPDDIKLDVINNVCSQFPLSTEDACEKLAQKNRLYIKADSKIETKYIKCNIN